MRSVRWGIRYRSAPDSSAKGRLIGGCAAPCRPTVSSGSLRNEVEKHVKPAWFDYYAPRALDEALHILGDAGQDGRVLAGGQSLMPMLNLRILSPAVVVDINRIDALNRLHAGPDDLTVGALVRHADLLRNPDVREG